MAIESSSRHLIQVIYQTKGWNLYKTTALKSGRIISRVYKQQVIEGKKVTNMTRRLSKGTSTLTKTFSQATNKQNDLIKALKRAAVVAPIWLALRSVMMKTIRTITDGNKAWEEWDKAMIKSKAVIHTTTMTVSDAYIRLQDEVEQLSLKTGVSLAKITNAFFRFGTLGIEFEDSLAGMTASMNIALTMGGDLEQVARPLAFAFKLLGDTMNQSIPVNERMTELGAKMFAIWKINAFEINEFSSSLNNFLPTANTANFSINETVTLLTALSSSAILGARGGRLLRQSVLRLVANLGDLSSELGIAVNPKLESTNDILLKVLGRIKELGEKGSMQKAGKALTAIFGGARMGEAARGLISVFDLIQENTDIMSASGKELDELLKNQADRLKDVTNALNKQMEISRNLDTQIGRMFLKGIFGGEKYAETLKKVNKFKLGLTILAEKTGFVLTDIFLQGSRSAENYRKKLEKISETFKEALAGKLPTGNIEMMIKGLEDYKLILPLEFDRKSIIRDLKVVLAEAQSLREGTLIYRDIETGKEFESFEKMQEFVNLQEDTEEIIKRINHENQIKLNLLQKGTEIAKLESTGLSKSQIAHKKLTAEIKERVNQFNNLKDLEKLGFEKLKEKQILLLLETKEYEKILELTNEQIFDQDKLVELVKMQSNIEKIRFKENQQRMNLLVKHEKDLLKIRGASIEEIFRYGIALENLFSVNQGREAQLRNELSLEKLITKEKLGQIAITPQQKGLKGIYEKFGGREAMTVSNLLPNLNIDIFNTLNKKFQGILREFFPSRIQNIEEQAFFKTGFGRNLRRPELDIENITKQDTITPTKEDTKTKLPDINTVVEGITINIKQEFKEKLIKEEITKKIRNDIADAIANDPRIIEAIDEQIEQY